MRVNVAVGNPNRSSRTTQVARAVVEALLAPGSFDLSVFELADYASSMFDLSSDEVNRAVEDVRRCELLVVASPTYKASYTGLLKAFLDRYPTVGLKGVVAIPVMTGGDWRHQLAPDLHLRPLLVELGAVVPTVSLYCPMQEFENLDRIVDEWATGVRMGLTDGGAALHCLMSGS